VRAAVYIGEVQEREADVCMPQQVIPGRRSPRVGRAVGRSAPVSSWTPGWSWRNWPPTPTSSAFRHWLVTKLDAHTDLRVGRYWELVGIIQGRPDEEFAVRAADWAWLLAALRQHAAARSTHRSAPLQAAEASGYQ
jgi:hypothetical protein